VKPAPFDYVRAESVSEALGVLAEEGGDARVIAGGQTLMPMLAMRLARPKVLVDIMGLEALSRIETGTSGQRVGASVRQAELLAHSALTKTQPLLAAALPWVGHAQTRSRGTVCGSVAHADPSAEIPLVLVVLGGTVELASRERRRSVAAQDFLTGMMSTDRADDELIEAIVFPSMPSGAGTAFAEYGRRHGDFALCACAAVARADGLRFAVGGVADRPVAVDWPADLAGSALDDALDAFAWDLDARDDMHATARYRRDLVRRMGRSTIEEACRCRA
jgi:2-furoyl-CoA dehydrogenase FAD binding subunit